MLQGEGREPPSSEPRQISESSSNSGSIAGSSSRGCGSGRGGRSNREWGSSGGSYAVCGTVLESANAHVLGGACGGGFLGLGFLMTL